MSNDANYLRNEIYELSKKDENIFAKLNEYSIELTELSYDDLFPYIAKRIKNLFDVEEVIINLYDETTSEIVTKYSTFSDDDDNNKISKYLGGKIIGLRTPITKEGYDILFAKTISKVNSLHELTFGKIPDAVGKIVEKVYGIGWFINATLIQNKKLEGTIILVGKKGKEAPDSAVLETFIKITTSELSSKKTEEALRHSEAKLNALFSSMSEMVVMNELVFDDEGKPINYRIIDCNDAFTKITGITREKALGKLSTEVYGTDNPPYFEEFSRVAISGIPYHFEAYFKTIDKYFLISVVSPGKNNFVTITNDISELKRTEMLIQDKSEEITVQNEELNIANLQLMNAIRKAEESEANLRAILEGTQESIWAFDRNYNILYLNQVFKDEFYKSFGVQLDVGSNLIDCLPGFLLPIWKPRYDRVLANEQFTIEDIVETEVGTVYLQVIFNPIIKNGEVIGGSCFGSNITERKRAEKELRESHIRYKDLFDTMPNGFYRSTPEGYFVDANPAFIAMLGYDSLEELKTLNIPKDVYVKEEERYAILQDNTEFIDKMESYRLRKKDGSIIWVEDNARYIKDNENRIIYHEGICKDITERIRSAAELVAAKEKAEESEMNFRNLFENATDAIFIADEESGIILDVNHAAENLMLMDKNEIIGMHQSELHPPEKKEFSQNAFRKRKSLIENGKKLVSRENEIVRKDGSIVPVEIRANRLMFKGKECLVGTFRDISERKNAERELIKAKEKAEESDRLKSAFLANMSHEIRTPMNGILGFAQLLKEPDLSGEEQAEFISIIEKSGKRMLNIINDIVDISKIESGLMTLNITESNINEQMDYIFSFFQPEASQKNIQFSYKKGLSNELAFIRTDREKVFAIFTNLVKNAIKYTDVGSIDFGYTMQHQNNSKILQFYVKDTGIGIPKSHQQAIFERFIQTDVTVTRAYQGAGLGLAITKAYVEMLGGRIWVESDEGKGSTFYFTLPYKTETDNETNNNDEIKNDKSNNIMKLKILIAEDDKISSILMEKFIDEFSKEIIKVNNGIDAVATCRDNPDIDLVMMDIQMPGINGLEATRQIRSFNEDVIIIAQTAYGLAGDRELALEAGCNDYIAKPIDKDELSELLKKTFNL